MDPDQKPIIDLGGIARTTYIELLDTFPVLGRLIPMLGRRNGRIGLAAAAAGLFAAMIWARVEAQRSAQMTVDVQRVSHLQQLNLNIRQYYQDNKDLPAKLSDLEVMASPTYIRDWYMFDPGTRMPFHYDQLDQHHYQLCATFWFSTKEVAHKIPSDVLNPVWDHKSGPQCFKFETPELQEDDKALLP